MAESITKNNEVEDFRSHFKEIHDFWEKSRFYSSRQAWTRLLDRRSPVELDDFLKEYSDGIDIESAMLERDRAAHIQILTLDDPRIDCIPLSTSDDAKKDVEKNRIWHASSMAKQLKNLPEAIAQSLVQYGVAFMRKDWTMPEEPSEEYLGKKGVPAKEKGEDEYDHIVRTTTARLDAREDWFKEQDDHCFNTVSVSPLEMCCSPLDEPTVFFQRCVIPYAEAKKLKRGKKYGGGKLKVSTANTFYWVGDEQPKSDDSTYSETTDQKKIEILIRDARDPQTGQWKCTELVCIEGEDDSYEVLDEYENPLGRSRYFLIESGDAAPLETDPHLRFRPMLYAEYVLIAEKNYYSTLTAALARMKLSDSMFYMRADRMTDEAKRAFEVAGIPVEGNGANMQYVFKRATAGSGEIVALPGELLPWPFTPVDELKYLIEMTERELSLVRPNRFQTAEVGNAKEPQQTATERLQNQQASALPYSSYLGNIAKFWEQSNEAERNAILYWDATTDEGSEKQYPAVTTGNEPFLREPVDAGTEVAPTPTTFKRRYHIVIKINNVTQAEKLQNDLAADDAYTKGRLTEEQWLKQTGAEDPKRQLIELDKDEARKMMRAELAPIRNQLRKTYFSFLTNINMNAPMPMPLGAPQQGNSAGNGAPPMNGQLSAKPAILPAPVEQPNGSSGGFGGM